MKFDKIPLCAAILFLFAPLHTASANDYEEVQTVIQKYFDGTEKGMLDRLAEAFLESAEIQYIEEDGSLGRLPFPEYLSRFTEGREIERYGRLVSMDVTGSAATAKVEIYMASRGRVYTDYILLLKTNEGWRISNKVATWRPKF